MICSRQKGLVNISNTNGNKGHFKQKISSHFKDRSCLNADRIKQYILFFSAANLLSNTSNITVYLLEGILLMWFRNISIKQIIPSNDLVDV